MDLAVFEITSSRAIDYLVNTWFVIHMLFTSVKFVIFPDYLPD